MQTPKSNPQILPCPWDLQTALVCWN